MSTDLKIKAMELAVAAGAQDLIAEATRIFEFLSGAPAQPESSSSSASSTTPAAAPRRKRSSAAAASTGDASTATAASSSTSSEASTAAAPSAQEAPAAATPSTTGTSPASSTPSKDDIRAKLTAYQAKCGGDIAKPREILSKYAPTGTLGSLKEEDHVKLAAELDKAIAG
jgi:hypothetical protein